MAQEEKYGTRDRTYSAWHRRASTARFVGIELAQTLALIDLDASLWVECHHRDFQPLALIETARDVGQAIKPATLTRNLSRRTYTDCPNCGFKSPVNGVPAYCLLYTIGEDNNPADPQWKDIVGFRVKRLWPKSETEWRSLTPQEWAEGLVALRKFTAEKLDGLLGFSPLFNDAAE